MAKRVLPVPFEERQVEQASAQTVAEGRTIQARAHDALMNAVDTTAQRRKDVLDRVPHISKGLNQRLAT